MKPITFFVPGNPKALKRHRTFRTKSGINVNVDPSAGDKADFLAKAMLYRPAEPLDGPLSIVLVCVFSRPKGHFGTGRNAGVLKESAGFWYPSTPDWDNVGKFVGDAFNGIFWRDDRLIVHPLMYEIYGPVPGIGVIVREPSFSDECNAKAWLESAMGKD